MSPGSASLKDSIGRPQAKSPPGAEAGRCLAPAAFRAAIARVLHLPSPTHVPTCARANATTFSLSSEGGGRSGGASALRSNKAASARATPGLGSIRSVIFFMRLPVGAENSLVPTARLLERGPIGKELPGSVEWPL